MAKIKV